VGLVAASGWEGTFINKAKDCIRLAEQKKKKKIYLKIKQN